MGQEGKTKGYHICLSIILWGSLWGLFESTVGYLLHLLEVNIGWFLWYPAACFFMANVYRKTGKSGAVFLTGVFCASVKLINLLLPGRIDKVLNPAVSIVFEALSMAVIIYGVNRLQGRALPAKALAVLSMNTVWRILFVLYLLFLVPSWVRDLSVISDINKLLPFFIKHNFVTSAILLFGYQFKDIIFSPIEKLEKRIQSWNALPGKTAVFIVLIANIVLEYYL